MWSLLGATQVSESYIICRRSTEKTEKVAQWPQPSSKREVQQLLGLENYYKRFVKDFAIISKPLHRLTEKTAKFEWMDDCQRALKSFDKDLWLPQF